MHVGVALRTTRMATAKSSSQNRGAKKCVSMDRARSRDHPLRDIAITETASRHTVVDTECRFVTSR
jgi:hypothetical protein